MNSAVESPEGLGEAALVRVLRKEKFDIAADTIERLRGEINQLKAGRAVIAKACGMVDTANATDILNQIKHWRAVYAEAQDLLKRKQPL